MATSQELLAHGKKSIEEIKKLFGKQTEAADEAAWKLIRNTPQPAEWVLEGEGVTGGVFNYNPIGLIEELAFELFGDFELVVVSCTTMSDGKRHFAVTTTVRVHFKNKTLYGVATSVVDNLALLTLETPKTVPSAFKNALARLGSFFGRDLNRTNEDLPVINRSSDTGKQFDAEFEMVKVQLEKCKTREQAQKLIDEKFPDWKLNMTIKNIIQSKPSKQ
jgi:hypothetical protein